MEIVKYGIRLIILLAWIGLIYVSFMILPSLWQDHNTDVKSLRIYTWAHRIDETVLRQFEKESGIKVYLNYYESSEELLTKLEMTPLLDCDLMLPSGYVIQSMIKSKLVKPLDKTRCKFAQSLYPQFKGLYFDPNNTYSLPLYWDVFGIGYNANAVGDREITLDLLFDEKQVVGDKIGMSEDGREAIFLAAQYLGIPLSKQLTEMDLDKLQDLLYQQKSWVGAYTDSQQGYFLSSHTFAVVASDREIICRQMLKNPDIKFGVIPQGSMLRVDSVVINAATKKDDMIYEFLNFLFSHEIMLYHAEKFCILPTLKSAFSDLDDRYIGVPDLRPGTSLFKNLKIFQLSLSQKELNDFWIRFKAS